MLKQLKDCLAHCFPRLYSKVTKHPAAAQQPDAAFYQPLFSPWLGYGRFSEVIAKVTPHSLVSADRLWILDSLARQTLTLSGSFWECGVYKGGTARLLADLLAKKARPLRLFDTFTGMPETDPKMDRHRRGDFSDTSLEAVQAVVGRHHTHVSFHPGLIPETFAGLEGEAIAFAHVDVDIFRSVLDCCEFIYPRLEVGGIMIFDDYGFPSCPGARAAVDAFFEGRPEVPLVLPTGQAIAIKLG